MSYASSIIDSSLNLENVKVADMDYSQQFQQGVSNTVVKSAVDSAVYGTDFEDSLKTGLVTNVSNLGFRAVGDYEVNQLNQGDTSWSDGSINKTLAHSLVGGAVAELQGGEFKAGAVAAGTRELLSPLTENASKKTQQLTSQLAGVMAGGLADGEDGANVGYNVATSAEDYNRQLHKDEIALIKQKVKQYAEQNNLSEEQASKELLTISKVMNDKKTRDNTPILTKEKEEAGFIAYNGLTQEQLQRGIEFISENSKGMYITDVSDESMKTQQAFTSTPEQFENPYYDLGTTLGLEDQSYILFLSTKVGETFYTTGKEVTPFVVRQGGQVYDDVTLNATNQLLKVSPKAPNYVKGFVEGFDAKYPKPDIKYPYINSQTIGYGTRKVINILGE